MNGLETGCDIVFGIIGRSPIRKDVSLIRLGINQGQAYAWSRTRMGGWAVAQSLILGTTLTIKRLKQGGYTAMMEYDHEQRSI